MRLGTVEEMPHQCSGVIKIDELFTGILLLPWCQSQSPHLPGWRYEGNGDRDERTIALSHEPLTGGDFLVVG